jgi:predicted N-acetyltransferase YhbS
MDNIVFSAEKPQEKFHGWDDVPRNLKTTTGWNSQQRRVRKGEVPSAFVVVKTRRKLECADHEYDTSKTYALYHVDQTTEVKLTPLNQARHRFWQIYGQPSDRSKYLRWTKGNWEVEGYLQEWKYRRRQANESDTEGIHELLSMRSATDVELITKLRDSGHIEFELVATHDSKIVGHVAFAQMTMDTNKPVDAMLMLPVVVHPDHLSQEIDSDLVFDGLQQCEKLRKRVVFTYGQARLLSDSRFKIETEVVPQPSLPEWMSLELWDGAMAGVKGKAIPPENRPS